MTGTTRRAPRRLRDRHGRGLRGELVPPALPGHRTRAERFDDLVLDAVERLEERWEPQLRDVEFAVEDVPPPADPRASGLGEDPVPLARSAPGTGRGRTATPPRVIVYRRPIEARARDPLDLADLVFDVVVHEVAALLGLEPEAIDPEGHGPPED